MYKINNLIKCIKNIKSFDDKLINLDNFCFYTDEKDPESFFDLIEVLYIKIPISAIVPDSLFTIILRTKEDDYRILDPKSGKDDLEKLQPQNYICGYILFEENYLNNICISGLSKKIIKYSYKYLFSILGLSLITSYLQMFLSLISILVLSYLIPTNVKSNFIIMALIIFLITIINFILRKILLKNTLNFQSIAKVYLTRDIFCSLFKKYNKNFSSGDASERISELLATIEELSNIIVEIPHTLFTLFFSFYLISLHDKQLAFLYISISILISMIHILLAVYLQEHKKNLLKIQSKFTKFISDLILSLEKIKTSSKKYVFFHILEKLLFDLSKKKYFLSYTINLSNLLESFVTTCTYLVFLVIIKNNFQSSNISPSSLIVFITISSQLLLAVIQSSNYIIALIYSKTSINRANDIMDEVTDLHNDNKEQYKNCNIYGSIDIQNISFSYGKHLIFENLNLSIKKNSSVVICGKSGSGKSSILKLLLGQIKSYSGNIFIDSYNINSINNNHLNKHIGYVKQDDVLFSGSILFNVTLGQKYNLKNVSYVFKKLGLDLELDNMPMGIHTMVNYHNISGGQKQKILIARAILKNPKILLLDEATSNLDPITEQKILNYLMSLQITRIIVTHKPGIIRSSDKQYFLQDGKITVDQY